LKSCLSPLGIETERLVHDDDIVIGLKSCLSPLGIETVNLDSSEDGWSV